MRELRKTIACEAIHLAIGMSSRREKKTECERKMEVRRDSKCIRAKMVRP